MYELICRVTQHSILKVPALSREYARTYMLKYVGQHISQLVDYVKHASYKWENDSTTLKVVGETTDGLVFIRAYELIELSA
jgi:hypothetical protein